MLVPNSQPSQDIKPDVLKDTKIEQPSFDVKEEVVGDIKEEQGNDMIELKQEIKTEPMQVKEVKEEPSDSIETASQSAEVKNEFKPDVNSENSSSSTQESSSDLKLESQNSQPIPESPSPAPQPQQKPRVKKGN